MLTIVHMALYTVPMTDEILTTGTNGGQTTVAEKDRVRLTVYVDAPLEERFRREAEENYRSLSDHMNAILAEHYGTKDGKRAAAEAEKG